MKIRFREHYRPLYFLSALGMGGLSVTFFMYLMFLVPHPASPIPTFGDLAAVYAGGNPTAMGLVTLALFGIVWFAVRHFQLLFANLAEHRRFTRSEAYAGFTSSNAEVQLMAIPLTLGMTVNVAFILAALAIPGLWAVKEYLFPVALMAVTAIGGLALSYFGRYLTRILTSGAFNIEDTNHFSQVLPSFAFTMVAVGYSSPAAMSSNVATSVIGMLGSFVFLAAAAAWILVKLPVSFGAMLRNGMAREAGPTLWMGIPIFTLVGIATIRITSGLFHSVLDAKLDPIVWFVFFGLLVAAQLVMGLFGYAVMRKQDYFAHFVRGDGRSIASYGLICPGVALVTLAQFFIHWGLVQTGIVTVFSPVHLGLLAAVAALQLVTIVTLARLNRKLYGTPDTAPRSVAAQRELAEVNA